MYIAQIPNLQNSGAHRFTRLLKDMATAKELLSRMLVIVDRQVLRLEEKSEVDPLLTTEIDDLCKYISVTRMLLGKELEDEEDEPLSEDEIDRVLEEHGRARRLKGVSEG